MNTAPGINKTAPASSKAPEPRLTPAMKQFVRFKKSHPDCVLFFRMGDFYEMFYEDAKLAHKVLGITLTQRSEGVPMAGVPYHAVEGYLQKMIEAGYRAVLESDPPFTAAALEAIVAPGGSSAASFLGLVHQLGVELAGLSGIGENPFAGLDWLLPRREDLFARVGAGELSAANLLFAHGAVRAGRHSQITGPWGRRQTLALASSERDLNTDERRRWPALASLDAERDRIHLRTIAAEFDNAAAIVREGEVDLLALRIEPLDILTHAHFVEVASDGQDNGRGLLFSVYRYIDARLAEVHSELDADDVLIVMSDHGIRTAMQHSPDAMFVAAGAGVPVGRATGSPALRGVPRVLADLLGVPCDWPDSGLAPWARVRTATAATANTP